MFTRLALSVLLSVPALVRGDEPVDFNRDIRPLLAKNCFACHGPDAEERQAGLRLDVRDGAIRELETGSVAVVPGDSENSELYVRITEADDSLRMPPPDTGHVLKKAEIETVRRWIREGAKYAEHWSFVKPVRPSLPTIRQTAWPRNAIDVFILAKLERAGLSPSPEADRYALIRRLSLDLRGLPPTLAEVEVFVADERPGAYERLVDRFLADPAFGERWAALWLDLARYADSAGYGSDPLRTIWRYRDWVINAYNRNLPFDQFTIEQLAGDLLPNPTTEQLVATAFHRNTMTNTEGGTDDEEFRVAAVKDRVDTTLQVWMGLTMGCAKCHNHKYDPISQAEYYRFYAVFNQTADRDQPNESPVISAPTATMQAELARLDLEIAKLRASLDVSTPELQAAQAKWETATLAALESDGPKPRGRVVRIELPGKGRMLSLAEVQVFSGGQNIAVGKVATQSSTAYDGPAKLAVDGNTNGNYFEAKSTTHTNAEDAPWWQVDLGASVPIDKLVIWNRTDGGVGTRLEGFRIELLDEQQKVVWSADEQAAPPREREIVPGTASKLPADVLTILRTPAEKRNDAQRTRLAAYFRSVTPLLDPVRSQITQLEKSRPSLPTVPVMQELPPENRRETYVMIKGNFLERGETVKPGLPEHFHPRTADVALNRLGVAKWLVHPDNPLTSRVTVNRFWAQFFGRGLVETEEDFGTQGELPTHPELLDWLATELVRQEWDVKRWMRLVVTSATYRQSSGVAGRESRVESAAAKQRGTEGQSPQGTKSKSDLHPSTRDPQLLYARGPRFRLKAEAVRDQALALSGLLSREIGGPSVFPPQPDGLWRAAFNGRDRTWETSTGADRYRRGLYTFWRRTVPYPSMATFDAPSREICNIRRIPTNTPLQAFVTLNDPAYVEAAQALARRILHEGGATPESQAKFALRLCLSRPPQEAEIQAILKLHARTLAHYEQDVKAATTLATDPLGPLPPGMDAASAAAWTVVGNVLLNLDAVLSKG